MKRWLLATAMMLAVHAASAGADYRLTLVHTNDFHSRFGPVDRFDHDCTAEANATGGCFGGSARLATAIADTRARADNVVLLDAGDQFPTPGSPAAAQPGLLAELMNRMGYDAMAPGNHEFDEGPAVLRAFVERLAFPVLMANADLSGEPLLSDLLAGSTVIERGGEKLGLIGLTTPEAERPLEPAPSLDIADPLDAVQGEVDRLTAAGVNKIIVLSHCGLGADERLAKATTGIDVIVGGHSHSYLSNGLTPSQGPYPTMVNGVAIVHTFPFGSTLGRLALTFDAAGTLIEAVGDQVLLDASVAEDPEIRALIATRPAEQE